MSETVDDSVDRPGTPRDEQDNTPSEVNGDHASNGENEEENDPSSTTLLEDTDTLDEGEILELQAFIPRREWIEEKIKFLEQLPPVELFDNLELLKNSNHDPIPGLPTREELHEWVTQHDAIEHEAEQFDANDMKRLKKFAKAATKRNLSPADTDLIEVTLTTLLGLDKLIHLLRTRSDSLDLIDLRLTWEEKRLGAWDERRAIQSDVQRFIQSSARWSPATYDSINEQSSLNESTLSALNGVDAVPIVPASSQIPGRRNSGMSVVSRGVRYRIAEDLTREAGRVATRLAAWKRNYISPAGKALDRMIEKKTVPEGILDEQDRLEDSTRPMDTYAKFAMEVVGQWKKADELYGELKKDQVAAAALQDDLSAALQTHPSSRADNAFLVRSQALSQRLAGFATIANPRLFPKPAHPFFPDQEACNDSIVSVLSKELTLAEELTKAAFVSAKEYHRRNDTVKRIDELTTQISSVSERLRSCVLRLTNGTPTSDGTGSPIDLTCCDFLLDPLKHSSYLALIPVIVEELENAVDLGTKLVKSCRASMLDLATSNLDGEFSRKSAAALEDFERACDHAQTTKLYALDSETCLRDIRKVWTELSSSRSQLDGMKAELAEFMERSKWLPVGQEVRARTPLLQSTTPTFDPPSIPGRLKSLEAGFPGKIVKPFTTVVLHLNENLGPDVINAVESSSKSLSLYLENVRGMLGLSDVVIGQSKVMTEVQSEVATLDQNMKLLIDQLSSARSQMTQSSETDPHQETITQPLIEAEQSLQRDVDSFINGLSNRIRFIGRPDVFFPGPLRASRISLSKHSVTSSTEDATASPGFVLPLDVAALDHSVRADANNWSLQLSNLAQRMSKHLGYLRLVAFACGIDQQLDETSQEIDAASRRLAEQQHFLNTVTQGTPREEESEQHCSETVEKIELSKETLDQLAVDVRGIAQTRIISLRDALQVLLEHPGAQDAPVNEEVVAIRLRKEKEVENSFDVLDDEVEQAKQTLEKLLRQEKQRLEKLRREAEEKARLEEEELRQKIERERLEKEEEERLRREEAERIRAEQEELIRQETARRLQGEEEERRRQELEHERLRILAEEVKRQEEEQARRKLEEEEKAAKITQERLEREAEELRIEEERARRQKEEAERLAKEKEDRIRQKEMEALRQEALRQQENARALGEQLKEEQLRVLEAEERARNHIPQPIAEIDDVFTLRVVSESKEVVDRTPEMIQLQKTIAELRNRLRSLSLHSWARPAIDSPHAGTLPSPEQVALMQSIAAEVQGGVEELPEVINDTGIEAEKRSLEFEIEASKPFLSRCQELAWFSGKVVACDNALSDLLDHVDSYPSVPPCRLSSSHRPDPNLPPEEQLKARVQFAKTLFTSLHALAGTLSTDDRVITERERLDQTWKELEEMCQDCLRGRSRPASATSGLGSASGRASSLSADSASSGPTRSVDKGPTGTIKRKPRGTLSVNLRPTTMLSPNSLRTVSAAMTPMKKSGPQKMTPSRSVSGPNAASPSSTIHRSTFASRQRTNSNTAELPLVTPSKRSRYPPTNGSRQMRPESPTLSESSTTASNTLGSPSKPRSNSTWSRSSRQSFGRAMHEKPLPPVRKKYVPDPKNKLDVAVGKVVNKMDVHVPIQAVSAPGWEDKSGKYWIGDEEPKLCFCRILRSQMVMVRVGGGWCELGKFLRDHFSHLVHILPEPDNNNATKLGSLQEKWISSATFIDNEAVRSPVKSLIGLDQPTTPEPKILFNNPAILLNTPSSSGKSPSQPTTHSSPGSPLTPLQFLRRAEASPQRAKSPRPQNILNRSTGPSTSTSESPAKSTVPSTPLKPLVWR